MTYQSPFTPARFALANPHGFAYGSRVILPDGRCGMVSKVGYKNCHVDADTGADWKGHLVELRPEQPAEVGVPRVQQLALF